MNLVLIGYRGTGKTTVAQQLAQTLGWPWFDADTEVERLAGQSIATLFAERGEPAFRELECQVLAGWNILDKCVLAAGGGAVLRPENRTLLRSLGPVLWLTAEPDTLWRRMTEDPLTWARRPNLTSSGGLAEVRELLIAREPFYRETASAVFDTEHKTPTDIADDIVARFSLGPKQL